MDSVVSTVELDNVTFQNTLDPLALADAALSSYCNRARLLEAASGDHSIRITARQVHIKGLEIYERFHSSREIFARVDAVYRSIDEANLDEESKKLAEKWYHACLNEGCQLNSTDSNTLRKINEQIRINRSAFRKVLVEAKDCILLTEDELAGLPKNLLDSLEQETEEATGAHKFRLPLKSTIVKIALTHIHDGNVRKAIFEASERSVSAALAFFMAVLRARYQKANLLGNKSWAERQLSQNMMRNPETVQSFLSELQDKLTPLAKMELQTLKEMKREHCASLAPQNENSQGYYIWDKPYYHEQHLKRLYQLDSQMLSEYFPVGPVLKDMLAIFGNIFSICFIEVDEPKARTLVDNPKTLTWHPNVKMFLVWERNAQDSTKTKNHFIGYLYVDLIARTGKYSTCANFNIRPGYMNIDGKRQPCATVLLTSFPPPAANKPTLLQHSNVIQMFHELGHAMHDLLSRTRYASLHGHQVPRDFVEVPSHMLENWCWVPDQLS